MATNYDPKKEKEVEEEEEVKKFRITITSTKVRTAELLVKRLSEKVSELADENDTIKCTGPGRFPRKTLKLCIRKSPCGNGTSTFEHYEMRIFKRTVTLWSSYAQFQVVINSLGSESDVVVEALCFDDDEE